MRVFWGLLLVLLGIAFLGDNLRWYEFDLGYIIHRYWPVVLVALGGWMIFEKTRSRKHEGEWSNVGGGSYKKTVGDLRLRPTSIDPQGMRVEEGMGDIDIDLSQTTLNTGENKIEVSLGIGDIRITLPKGVPVSATGQAGAGDVEVLGQRRDGFGKDLAYTDDNFGSADIKIRIFAKVGMGDVRIMR